MGTTKIVLTLFVCVVPVLVESNLLENVLKVTFSQFEPHQCDIIALKPHGFAATDQEMLNNVFSSKPKILMDKAKSNLVIRNSCIHYRYLGVCQHLYIYVQFSLHQKLLAT